MKKSYSGLCKVLHILLLLTMEITFAQVTSAESLSCRFSKIQPGGGGHAYITPLFEVDKSVTKDEITTQWRKYVALQYSQGPERPDYDGRYCMDKDDPDNLFAIYGSKVLTFSEVTVVDWKPSNSQTTTGNPAKPEQNDKKALAYMPPNNNCIQIDKDERGRVRYTNICGVTIEFGYCNVYAGAEGDRAVCHAQSSEFSPTGYNYIAQSGGLKPGASTWQSFTYTHQATYLVACKNGFPLIQSFSDKTINETSKSNMTCWNFKENVKD